MPCCVVDGNVASSVATIRSLVDVRYVALDVLSVAILFPPLVKLTQPLFSI